MNDERWWQNEMLYAGLTAVLTVAVAVAAFLSAQAASDSDDAYATANVALTDANFLYQQGLAAITEDLTAQGEDVDRDCLLERFVEGSASFCGDDDADSLQQLVDEDPVIIFADTLQAVTDDAFEMGLEKSKANVDYQLALVILAVGLALSAWASLSSISARVRPVFGGLALIALIVGVVRMITI